ncbi:replication endonuclease [Pseudoalteromonas sp. CNC9-20]|uniref:replication endonuclease n=1 Tax=Pseudoalteromonas sp. CNC9-20 TaxID=2917750 RepID=UPI001EF4277E|nr:replication endonuclease [Pseudoalteromonas sp. CNC9-20]MCG7569187.1 replication endonuclease [Pseudoalteromonas sp. CNC9-20]
MLVASKPAPNQSVLNPITTAIELTSGLGVESQRVRPLQRPHHETEVENYWGDGKVKINAPVSDPFRSRIYTQENACNHHRERIFRRHSDIAVMMANGYKIIEKFQGYVEANRRLDAADKALTLYDISLSVPDDDICDIADRRAYLLSRKRAKYGPTLKTYYQCAEYVRKYDIAPPELPEYFTCAPYYRNLLDSVSAFENLAAAINRMCCDLWWRRNLRKLKAFRVEQLARDLRLVHKKAHPYVSQHSLYERRNRKAKTDALLSDLFVVPDDANFMQDFESLADIASRSHTSGKQQAAELMVRIRGFEELAQMLGHKGEFYTITAPSRFHSVNRTGFPNAKYQFLSPADAQSYFNDLWARARARFAKAGIKPYGFRVVEPHHDGCPHWHMLLFLEKGESAKVRKILSELATKDTPEEVKTKATRFKAIRIDPAKGSAAGYIAKYITKGITGDNLDKTTCPQGGDLNVSTNQAAESATTWASNFNIRRFQQIGGPTVSAWRELRRLGQGATGQCEVANAMNTDLNNIEQFALEKVRAAADSSDWAAFCIAMGGVQVKRKDQTVRLHYQVPDIVDRITGEISRAEGLSPMFKTKYGDQPNRRILGVSWDSVVVLTRKGTSMVMTEKQIAAQRKVMIGVRDSIDAFYEDGFLMEPSREEMAFLESMCVEDTQNMCLFMDYEALQGNVSSDDIPYLGSENFSAQQREFSSRQDANKAIESTHGDASRQEHPNTENHEAKPHDSDLCH